MDEFRSYCTRHAAEVQGNVLHSGLNVTGMIIRVTGEKPLPLLLVQHYSKHHLFIHESNKEDSLTQNHIILHWKNEKVWRGPLEHSYWGVQKYCKCELKTDETVCALLLLNEVLYRCKEKHYIVCLWKQWYY